MSLVHSLVGIFEGFSKSFGGPSPKYDLPLTSWISLCLNRKRLDEIIEKVNNGQPLGEIEHAVINGKYIEKILREEAVKQFSDSKRPTIEVILNSIDARPEDAREDYRIYVDIRRNKFVSADNGNGMSLDEVLRLLIIPFNTEKDGFNQIGSFGVGFL